MAKAGAGEVSDLSPAGVSMLIALTDIAPCFVGDVSARSRRLNTEGYHLDSKHYDYRCYRGGCFSSRSDAASTSLLFPSRIAPMRVPGDSACS